MIPTVQSTSPTPSVQKSDPGTSSGLTSDFETFLRMLTAQARNQDPLEPLDSSEYASQLAQFSMVEQQVKTNDMLTDLAQSFASANLGQLTQWVGMDVQSAAAFHFGNTPVTLYAKADASADKADLVVKNAQGAVVSRVSVPVDQSSFQWAGVDQNGTPLPAGAYSAQIESFRGRDLVSSQPVSAFSRVVQAQGGADGIILTLNSGARIASDQVSQIRTGS